MAAFNTVPKWLLVLVLVLWSSSAWAWAWECEQLAGATTPHTAVALADVDRDGTVDVVAALDDLVVARGDGNGFRPPQVALPGELRDMIIADLDGDGLGDVVVASPDDVSWLKAQDVGGFQSPERLFEHRDHPSYRIDIVAGDLDGDRDVDLVSTDDRFASAWENTGGGPWNWVEVWRDGGGLEDIALGDLDNDGDDDIVLAANPTDYCGYRYGCFLGLLWYQSQGMVFVENRLAPDEYWHSVAVADIDGDGWQDLLPSDWVRGAAWLQNLGGGTFADARFLDANGGYGAVGVDLDHDGRTEVVTTTDWPVEHVATLEPAGGAWRRHMSPAPIVGLDLLTTDADADGDEDLVYVGPDGLTWCRNAGPGCLSASGVAVACTP